ncbi:MAG TPA: DUF481 domain-containing protein [Gammaproteobacteria bacterium]|nr:DUF481 domain-containing protein [Gammaproteobacteria bacterium]
MSCLPRLAVVPFALCLPLSAAAADHRKPFQSEIDLSYARVQGDSDASTLSGETMLEWNQPKWREQFHALAYHQKQDGTTSAERYSTDGEVDYKFTDTRYTYGSASYDDDRFSGYDYETAVSVGYGWTLIDDGTTLLSVDTGPGYRYRKLKDPGASDEGGGEVIYRASGRYETDVTETLRFRQSLEVKAGRSSTQTTSKTTLLNKMTDHLSLKVSYALDHETNVPAGKPKTNTRFTLGVAYKN